LNIKTLPLITPREKRFIRSWQEQREGGKWAYYLLYTFGGGFIITLVTYILILWVLQIRVPRPYWLLPVFGVTAALFIAVMVWGINEKKFKGIIRREIKLDKDNSPGD
jgi:FtsH-binding integral membrane protein